MNVIHSLSEPSNKCWPPVSAAVIFERKQCFFKNNIAILWVKTPNLDLIWKRFKTKFKSCWELLFSTINHCYIRRKYFFKNETLLYSKKTMFSIYFPLLHSKKTMFSRINHCYIHRKTMFSICSNTWLNRINHIFVLN